MIKKAFFSVLSAFCMTLNAEILVSDSTNRSVSFPFNVELQGEYLPEGRVFVTTPQAVPGNNFSLAAVRFNTQLFQGLTPETVTLDGKPSELNPLHGAALQRASLLGAQCVVLARAHPSSLFLVDDQNGDRVAVYGAYGIGDASKKKATSIVGLTTNATTVFEALALQAPRIAFAAVSNRAGLFDGDGSGIAVLFFKRFENKGKKSFLAWDSIDAVTGESQYSNEGIIQDTGNRAFPFGKTTPQVFITTPVDSLRALHDMHFDRDLGILYLAIEAKGGAGSRDGVRALVLASCRNGKLQLQASAPDSVFESTDSIIGGRGSSLPAVIYKVRTMQTRTYLRYVVVVGGTGDSNDLKRQVHALPVVDNLASPAHGALASVISPPISLFSQGNPARFQTRVYAVPAEKPSDLYTSNALQARVGGSVSLPGPISDILVRGEAVFVSIEEADEGLQPGIFYSQPLFNAEGSISAWTNWQRVAGTGDPVRRFSYNTYRATHTYIPVGAKNTTQTVLRTAFSDEISSLEAFITAQLPQAQGGVQGLFDFPVTTNSFSTTPGKRLAVQAYCGYKKVVLVQTGKDKGNLFGPLETEITAHTSLDGKVGYLDNDRALSFTGEALNAVGPLSSCVVLTDGTWGWFVVGGAEGIAILADAQGRGWDARVGLQTGFKGLRPDMQWQVIQNIAHVRKIVAFEGRLFVLTDDKLVRYEVTAERIVSKTFDERIIASSGAAGTGLGSIKGRSFSDVIISGPLAVLATSFGLIRSGNFIDVQTVQQESSVFWTPIELPESVGSVEAQGPVARLFAVTPTADERDCGNGGTLWALNAYVSLNQALLYRFVVSIEQGVVTDSTVRLYPDYFFSDKKTFFTTLGQFRNYVVTDGSLIALSRSAFRGQKPLLELLPSLIKSGEINGARARTLLLTVPDNSFSMGKLVRNSASGAWMATGDFGVRVQS